jgi:ABC-2 type transport system permease protein
MNVIVSEWTKLRTIRSSYWTLGLLVVLTIGLSIWLAIVLQGQLNAAHIADNRDTLNLVGVLLLMGLVYLSQVVSVVLGSMTITSEYGSGMIRTSLTTISDRVKFALSKGLVFGVTVFVVAFVAALIAVQAIGLPIIFGSSDDGPSSGDAWRIVLMGALYVTLVGLIAYGLGLALRHTAAAISVTLGLIFVLPILGNAIPHVDFLDKYSPMSAGIDALMLHPDAGALSAGMGLLTDVLWAVAALIYGLIMITTRDS